MKDVLLDKKMEVFCLDKGFVKIIDCMPRQITDNENSADYAIAEAARCSYKWAKIISEDRKLIRYLMRKAHTSPFEQIDFKFHIKLPMYICTQVLRHRTASMNILSGRFSKLSDDFYVPDVDNIKYQNKIDKQGSSGTMDLNNSIELIKIINENNEETYKKYEKLLDKKMTREQARGVLPYNIYTEMYWKMDLHNLLHFLDLRCDNHSQWEIQQFSNAILELITPIVPITIKAWNDYSPYREAILFSKLEIEVLKKYLPLDKLKEIFLNTDSKSEQQEWVEKLIKIENMKND